MVHINTNTALVKGVSLSTLINEQKGLGKKNDTQFFNLESGKKNNIANLENEGRDNNKDTNKNQDRGKKSTKKMRKNKKVKAFRRLIDKQTLAISSGREEE